MNLHRMKKLLSNCGAAAVLAVLLPSAGVAQGQDQTPPAPVTVARVTEGNLNATITTTGTVVSRNDARLAAEVTGRLDWVAEPGTRVANDAPLARVDARMLELQLREDEAQLARLGANVDLLDSQLARLNALPPGIASQSQIDEATARHAMAKHELEQSRASRDRTKHLIERAVIRAPFPGHVVERLRRLREHLEDRGQGVGGNTDAVIGSAQHARAICVDYWRVWCRSCARAWCAERRSHGS